MIILLSLLFLEVIIIVVAAIRYLVKGYGFVSRGIKFEQPKLSSTGQIVGLIGLFLVVGLPRIAGVRDDYSEHGLVIYLVMTSIGTLLIVIGTQLGLAAYRSKEKSSKWVRGVSNILK